MYKVVYTKHAQKDAQNILKNGLKEKTMKVISILEQNPFQTYPPYKKLVGDLEGLFSRRINTQHRVVYEVDEKEKIVKIIRMWTHYE